MVTPHLPPEQAANALLPPIVAGELAAGGVACSFVSHAPASPAATTAGARDLGAVTFVPRRGRRWVDRTRAGAAVVDGRPSLLAAPIARRLRHSAVGEPGLEIAP